MKDKLHHRQRAAWAQGQDAEVDDTTSLLSDDSLTLTAVSGEPPVGVVVQRQSANELLVYR